MEAEEFANLRKNVTNVLMQDLALGVSTQKTLLEQAADDIDAIGGSGGFLRARAETLLIDLIERFDTTRNDSDGMWPLSRYMADYAARENQLRASLEACIKAHKTGRYEPMVAAIEAAQKTLDTPPERKAQ